MVAPQFCGTPICETQNQFMAPQFAAQADDGVSRVATFKVDIVSRDRLSPSETSGLDSLADRQLSCQWNLVLVIRCSTILY